MPRLRLLPPVTVVDSVSDASAAMEYFMNRGGLVAIDSETTGLRKLEDKVLFWSLATEDRRYSISVEHLYRFDPLFQRADVTWALANAKFDMHMFANHGVQFRGPKWDIVVMDAMDDDTRAHGLKEQSWYNYEASWGDFKELFLDPEYVAMNLGLDKDSYRSFKELSVGDKLLFVFDERPDIVHDYASCDAYFTYMLCNDLRMKLDNFELPTTVVPEHESMFDLFQTLEVPLTDELWKMERAGINVDMDYVRSIDGPMRDGIAAAKKKLAATAGRAFNPSSADEVREILFDDPKGFCLKPVKYSSGGKTGIAKKSTDEKSLKLLSSRLSNTSTASKFIDNLLAFRQLTKLHGTYVKNVKKHLGPDGRIHSRINQAGPRTSRLSSADPNLQNIPVRNDPYKIRGMFIPTDGCDLIDADYPQIEFRIVAVLAEEEKMLDAIRRGWDIHSANASNMFNVPYEDIMEAVRKKDAKGNLTDYDRLMLKHRTGSKASGLGALYGEGAKKMAKDLGCSVQEAQGLIDGFFDRFDRISEFREAVWDYAYTNEMTYTMLGRCRRLWKINSGASGIEAEEKRQAFNTPIQGSSAEMMKLAIIRVGQSKEFRDLGGRLLMTIHDELLAEAPKETAKEANKVLCDLMGDPFRVGPINFTYPVSIQPDGMILNRWSEAK